MDHCMVLPCSYLALDSSNSSWKLPIVVQNAMQLPAFLKIKLIHFEKRQLQENILSLRLLM